MLFLLEKLIYYINTGFCFFLKEKPRKEREDTSYKIEKNQNKLGTFLSYRKK